MPALGLLCVIVASNVSLHLCAQSPGTLHAYDRLYAVLMPACACAG